jgi:hypothetical protein
MKQNNSWFLFSFLLVGCVTTSTSSLPFSSTATSSLTSAIPIPNAEFIPVVSGRTFLIESQASFVFTTTQPGELTTLPLAPNNFPVSETVVTAYAPTPEAATLTEEETLIWANVPLSNSWIQSLPIGESVTGSEVVDWLKAQAVSDQKWNQMTETRKTRNLSAAFLNQDDYYWFNHFVREETRAMTRYDNHQIYGEGDIHIMFQTEFEITPRFAKQIHADTTTIYEIYDETYPSGFFGAQDYQFRTRRTLGNFQRALTMGPIQMLLDAVDLTNLGLFLPTQPMRTPFESIEVELSLMRINATQTEISFRLFKGESFLTSEETFEIKAVLEQTTWQTITQTYYLWKPIVS